MSNVIHLPRPTDCHQEVADLVEKLGEQLGTLPADDLEPGYRLLRGTRDDLRQVAELLQDALELLDGAIDREDERHNEYYEVKHPGEALRKARP